jgi:hypothetical protein
MEINDYRNKIIQQVKKMSLLNDIDLLRFEQKQLNKLALELKNFEILLKKKGFSKKTTL